MLQALLGNTGTNIWAGVCEELSKFSVQMRESDLWIVWEATCSRSHSRETSELVWVAVKLLISLLSQPGKSCQDSGYSCVGSSSWKKTRSNSWDACNILVLDLDGRYVQYVKIHWVMNLQTVYFPLFKNQTELQEDGIWCVSPIWSAAGLSVAPTQHGAGQCLPWTRTSMFFQNSKNWTSHFSCAS